MWSELQNTYFSALISLQRDFPYRKQSSVRKHLYLQGLYWYLYGTRMLHFCKHLYQKVCVSADEIVTVIGFELTVIKNGNTVLQTQPEN